MGRTLLVWALGSGVPVLGILLAAILTLSLQIVSPTQFTVAVMILALVVSLMLLRRRQTQAQAPRS